MAKAKEETLEVETVEVLPEEIETIEVKPTQYRGEDILFVETKIINGKEYTETRTVSGRTFLD